MAAKKVTSFRLDEESEAVLKRHGRTMTEQLIRDLKTIRLLEQIRKDGLGDMALNRALQMTESRISNR